MKKALKLLLHSNNSENYIKFFKINYTVDFKFYNEIPNIKKLGDWHPDIVLLNNDEGVLSPDYNSTNGDAYDKSLSYDETNDMADYELIKRFGRSSLIVSIGRSSHLITSYVGGKVMAHVNNYSNNTIVVRGILKNQDVDLNNSISFKLYSKCNQLMYPFCGYVKYKVLAWSEKYQSDYYKEYDQSDYKLASNYLEPQIVYYPKVNSLCFQSHFNFEVDNNDSNTNYYVHTLISKYLNK